MNSTLRLLCGACLLLLATAGAWAEGEEKAAGNPVVVMTTGQGTIEIELFPDKAPISVENFLRYVDKAYYDGTIFHRVIEGFMIQGGGLTEQMTRKPAGDQIKNEADNGLKNTTGTIAMARTGKVDSATSQFFINTFENAMLDHKGPGSKFGYAVFGKVVSGMNVVRKIEGTPTSSRGSMGDVPVETILIESIKRK